MKKYIVLTALAAIGLSLSARPDAGRTAVAKQLLFDTAYVQPAKATLDNVALAGLRMPVSQTAISAGYAARHESRAAVAALGRGYGKAFFDANTYLHCDNATITAHAAYDNGTVFDRQGCENSDAGLLFPYFTADAVGGNMSCERYSFGGAYSGVVGHRFLYGAQAGYTALQESRNHDPRTKNIVGRLSASLGGGLRTGAYSLAVELSAGKYKQSNSILFVNEQGETPIYHCLGLGAHYARFAGAGKNSTYNGWWRGVQAAVAPDSVGAFGMARFTRFTFSKYLVDLNNLPIVSADHLSWHFQAGGKWPQLCLSANVAIERRNGIDNIFGTPTGSAYVQIAALQTYFYRRASVEIMAAWRHVNAQSRLDVVCSAACFKRAEKRFDFSTSGSSVKGLNLRCETEYMRQISDRWLFTAKIAAQWHRPTHCSLSVTDSQTMPDFMASQMTDDYESASHGHGEGTLLSGIDYLLGNGRSTGLRAYGTIGSAYRSKIRTFALSLIFHI